MTNPVFQRGVPHALLAAALCLGPGAAVAAVPDGYTLLLGSGGEVSIARMINPAVKYYGEIDLAAIGLIGTTPMVFGSGPVAQVETLARVQRAPANGMALASSVVGTPRHIAGDLISQKTGTTMHHMPYRDASQVIGDVLGGNVDFAILVLSSALPHLQSGRMTAPAVSTSWRSNLLPQVPTLSELPTFKDFNLSIWFGILGPVGMDSNTVGRINRERDLVLKDPDVLDKLQKAGVSSDEGSPQILAEFIRAETTRVQPVTQQIQHSE